MRESGKLVIIGILALALMAAGAGWLYRYSATNKAAQFWGPSAAQRIRDAPIVELSFYAGDDLTSDARDVSKARGLTHLRYALLEDRSFVWPARPVVREPRWYWALGFRNEKRRDTVLLLFQEDCREVAMHDSTIGEVISCAPISAGLREVFEEMSAEYKPSR
jgi:hypothetical protein